MHKQRRLCFRDGSPQNDKILPPLPLSQKISREQWAERLVDDMLSKLSSDYFVPKPKVKVYTDRHKFLEALEILDTRKRKITELGAKAKGEDYFRYREKQVLLADLMLHARINTEVGRGRVSITGQTAEVNSPGSDLDAIIYVGGIKHRSEPSIRKTAVAESTHAILNKMESMLGCGLSSEVQETLERINCWTYSTPAEREVQLGENEQTVRLNFGQNDVGNPVWPNYAGTKCFNQILKHFRSDKDLQNIGVILATEPHQYTLTNFDGLNKMMEAIDQMAENERAKPGTLAKLANERRQKLIKIKEKKKKKRKRCDHKTLDKWLHKMDAAVKSGFLMVDFSRFF